MLNPISPYFKVSLLAALLTTALMCSLELLAQQPPATPPVPERPEIKEKSDYTFIGSIREEMPLFPGCDDGLKYAARKKCADSLLVSFIYDNLRYPYQAWQDSVQGMAVVSFTVEKDGTVSDVRAVRDPGAGTGAEAVRLVNLMRKQNLRWTPGKQAGKIVRVQFNLPVKFKLADHDHPAPPPPPVPPPPMNCSDIFLVVDEMPCFPGCEYLQDEAARKQCSDQKLMTFLRTNFKFPPQSAQNCVEGTAVVSFVIEKDGTVTGIKTVRDFGGEMGEAAAEAAREMVRQDICWIPGRQSGRAVRVKYNAPIRIKLE